MIERKFAMHFTVLAARRALPKAGRRIEISNAMMPMTTSNSTSVNPRRRDDVDLRSIKPLLYKLRGHHRSHERHSIQSWPCVGFLPCGDFSHSAFVGGGVPPTTADGF